MFSLRRRTLTNPVYFASKVLLYGRSRLALRPSDVMLALYPKTGSTWLRFILYHYLSQRQETATFDEVNTYMPEYGHPSFFAKWHFEPVPRLIKTHRSHNVLFGNTRAVLVVRDPRDIMVSMYHYARAKRTLRFEGTIGDLLVHRQLGLVPFFEHFRRWAPRAGVIVRYEDLRSDPAAEVRRIFAFIGVAVYEAGLTRAIELSSVGAMRKAQQASKEAFRKYKRDFVFARAATSAQWVDQFGPAEREHYRCLAERYGFDLYPTD